MIISIASALPSRYSIGTTVYFYPDMWKLRPEVADVMALKGRIEKVQFSGSKVTYDLAIQCTDSDVHGNETGKYFYDAITVKDVDSTFVSTYEDLVEEWDRTIRICRDNALTKLRDAQRRLSDLDQGIVIPDNWYLDQRGDWQDPGQEVAVAEPCAGPNPEGGSVPAPLSAEASANDPFAAVRRMFEDLFTKLKERRELRDANVQNLVAWKEPDNGCA